MHEQSKDLRNCIGREKGCSDVGKWYDHDWVKHENLPDTHILQREDFSQEQNDENRDVGFYNVTDNV